MCIFYIFKKNYHIFFGSCYLEVCVLTPLSMLSKLKIETWLSKVEFFNQKFDPLKKIDADVDELASRDHQEQQ